MKKGNLLVRLLFPALALCLAFATVGDAAEYKYDSLNRLVEVTYDNGQKLNYTYDAAGNLLAAFLTVPAGLNVPPLLGRIGARTVAEGQTLAFTLTAADANGDTLGYSATGLPPGSSLDPSTGVFAWTPDYTRAGRYTVRFTVSDGTLTDSEDVLLTVLDAVPAVSLSIGDVSIGEGRTGSGIAVFDVTLSAPSPWDVAVDYATVDGTATAPGDYTAQAGRLIFPAGTTERNVSILIGGDNEDEPDESFALELTGAVNAAIAKGRGICTIVNDDQDAVTVRPVDGTTGTTPVKLTFARILQAGETTLITSPTGPPPPPGFRLGDPPVYYEISTTAVFSGPIDIWIDYAGLSFANESALRLFHYEGGAWVDRTVSVDTAHDIIRGQVDSLSPFAIFEPEPIVPPPAAVTWLRAYGGNGDEILRALAGTADGGYIVAGGTASPGTGDTDCLVVRLNGLGNIVWQKAFGGPSMDEAQAVCALPGGGFIVAGRTRSFGAGGDDLWIIRLSAAGEVLWQRACGGQADEGAAAILAMDDGGCIIAGTTSSFGAGGGDAWLLRLDASGGVIWQKAYGGGLSDRARAIVGTGDGGCLVAGESTGGGSADGWLLRLDGQGAILWQRSCGGLGADTLASLAACEDGGFLAAGGTASPGAGGGDAWVLRLDSTGDILWQKTYGGAGEEMACAVAAAGDGGWFVGGLCGTDLAVWKLSPDGAPAWHKTYGPAAGGTETALVHAEDGCFVLAGTLADGGTDFLLAKADAAGNILSCVDIAASGAVVSAGSGATAVPSSLAAIGTAAVTAGTNAAVSVTSWSERLPRAWGASFAVYAANSGGDGISAYRVDGAGALAEVPGSPFPAGVSPWAVALDPTGRYAYAAGADGLRAYAVDPATGGLHELPGSPFPAGAGTEAVAAHPSGRFVYAVNARANTVSGYTIDLNGSLTAIQGSPFPAGSYTRAIALDPLGRFAYVANSGSGGISAYAINPATGAFIPVPGSPFSAGFVPLSLAVDPFGRYLYAANSASDSLSVYRIDAATGSLAEIAGSPFPVPAGPVSLAVDPFGRYLCVLCEIERRVVIYPLDASSGAPVIGSGTAAYVSSGGGAVAVDPSGRFVYVTAGYADHLAVFAVDPRQGSCAETAGSPYRTGFRPAGLAAAHDPVPSVSVNDARGNEGHAGTTELVFTVSLSHAGPHPVVVDYATADAAASAGRDYLAVSGRLVFAPGVSSLTVSITVLGDMEIEPDESLLLKLTGISGAVAADSQGVGTIVNDDFNQPPLLEPIGNRTIDEGRKLGFTVRASDPDGDTLVYTAANLPAGAVFDAATGVFSWTPDYTQAGTYAGIRFSVSDGRYTVGTEIVITVRNVTPLDLVKALQKAMEGLGIHDGTKKSLLAKLENARKSLEKGQDEAAANKIEAFVHEVQAQRGKKIPIVTADELIGAAWEIIDLLGREHHWACSEKG